MSSNTNTVVAPSNRVMELLSNPEALKSATAAELQEVIKFAKAQEKLNKLSQKSAVSKERQDKLNKLKDIHTTFGYTDAAEFVKDYRAANMPAVTRMRISDEKRAAIEAALVANVKIAAIAVDNDVSESTVSNVKKAMSLKTPTVTTTVVNAD